MKPDTVRACAIPADGVVLEGELRVPERAPGVVLFAHGTGSSRRSPRNRQVARVLHERGIGTLLFDLLTEEEDRGPERRFDIGLLTARLLAATGWIGPTAREHGWALGYFGGSTGAAAALRAAAAPGCGVSAVVSRGGRPDLAFEALPHVRAATLFVVGELDTDVLELNRQAFDRLRCEKKLVVIPGATHLFEERGALEAVAHRAAHWFELHLRSRFVTAS